MSAHTAHQEQESMPAVVAASPQEEYQKAIVIKAHQATDGSQLNLEVNDIVYVLEKDESGWWGGHKHGEDNTGWFPGQSVKEVFGRAGDAPGSEPEAEDANMDNCSAGNSHQRTGQSPLYHQGISVASPQRMSKGTIRLADGTKQPASAIEDKRSREIAKSEETIDRLKEENRVLQSRGEVLASAEREKAVYLEEKLQATAADLNRAMADRERAATDAERLRQELQKEKRTSQVRQREAEDIRSQFEQLEQRLAEKDAEMNRNLAVANANERAAQEHCKEVAARAAELEHKQSVYRAEAEQANSILAEEGNETLRRRLFPSTFQEMPSPGMKNPAAGAPTSQYTSEVGHSPLGSAEMIGGARSSSNLARPVAQATGAAQRPPEPPQIQLPRHEPPRTGTSPWRTAGGRSGAPVAPNGEGMQRMRSTEQLAAGSPYVAYKITTAAGSGMRGEEEQPGPRTEQELPPRGVVAQQVMAFEKRCNTPVRFPGDASRGGSAQRSVSNSSRFRHEVGTNSSAAPSWRFAASAPNTSRGESNGVPGFSNVPSFNMDLQQVDGIADDGEVVLGMSPLHRR